MSNEIITPLRQKFKELICLLSGIEGAVVAFSGGVDSSFLLKATKMSGMTFLAVTAFSETMPANDMHQSISFAKEIEAEHIMIKTDELSNEAFLRNHQDRCFFCKDELFRKIKIIAERNNYSFIFDGSNTDDLLDFRPGRKAAALYGVRSPLAECNFSKDEIRKMSKELGLSFWDKPSSPCLSTRFPYGQRITLSDLKRVEKSEELLRNFGAYDIRVRSHGDLARIEVSEKNMGIFTNDGNRKIITKALKALGFKFVSLDLEGYKSGSMNRVLENKISGCQIKVN